MLFRGTFWTLLPPIFLSLLTGEQEEDEMNVSLSEMHK